MPSNFHALYGERLRSHGGCSARSSPVLDLPGGVAFLSEFTRALVVAALREKLNYYYVYSCIWIHARCKGHSM